MPAALQQGPSIGCRVLDWHGHKVTLVCFRTGSDGQQVAHLMVMDAREVRGGPGTAPQLATSGPWTTASWSDAAHVYLLASKATPEQMRRLIPTRG